MLIYIGSEREIWQLTFLVAFFLKIVDFRLVIIYFGTPQNAPDHTVFVKKVPGEHPPNPPSNSLTTQCYGPPTHLPCYYLEGNEPFLKEFLRNAYQIYTYLIYLKLNQHIGTNKQL